MFRLKIIKSDFIPAGMILVGTAKYEEMKKSFQKAEFTDLSKSNWTRSFSSTEDAFSSIYYSALSDYDPPYRPLHIKLDTSKWKDLIQQKEKEKNMITEQEKNNPGLGSSGIGGADTSKLGSSKTFDPEIEFHKDLVALLKKHFNNPRYVIAHEQLASICELALDVHCKTLDVDKKALMKKYRAYTEKEVIENSKKFLEISLVPRSIGTPLQITRFTHLKITSERLVFISSVGGTWTPQEAFEKLQFQDGSTFGVEIK